MSIDSYRFLDFASRQVMKAWAGRQKPDVIPFTPMTKPLAECSIALVSTAGIARNDDVPFDQERERRDPWWGDPSFRVIPLGTMERETIAQVLRECRWNRTRAAKRLGLTRTQLYLRLQKYGLEKPSDE